LTALVSRGKGNARRLRRARILLLADESQPEGAWKDADIAKALSAHARTVERTRGKCVESADFVCAMEDVLEVYHRPHDPTWPLVCFDEGSKQQTKETRLPLPPQPGDVAKYDCEYERNASDSTVWAPRRFARKRKFCYPPGAYAASY